MEQAQAHRSVFHQFPKPLAQPWKQDVKVFIDYQRAWEHLEGFRSTQVTERWPPRDSQGVPWRAGPEGQFQGGFPQSGN